MHVPCQMSYNTINNRSKLSLRTNEQYSHYYLSSYYVNILVVSCLVVHHMVQ